MKAPPLGSAHSPLNSPPGTHAIKKEDLEMPAQERRQPKWMLRTAGAILVVALASLVTVVATHRAGPPTRPTDSDAQNDRGVDHAEAGSPGRATRSPVSFGSLARLATAPASAAIVPPTSGPTEEKAPGQRAPSENERLAHAEAAFEAEVYDKSWAEPSRRTVEEHLARFTEPFARPGPVKCRSTLCRLDVAISGGAATAESYLAKLVRGRLWDGPAMFIRTVPDSNGKLTLTFFLGKEDTALPEPSATATM